MNEDFSKLLISLGLQEYEHAFYDAALDDLEIISMLTEADLEKLGLKMGHRKKLLSALANGKEKINREDPVEASYCQQSKTTSGSLFSGTPSQSLKIFISYGRDEYTSEVHAIRDAISARGHEVWFDSEQLAGGLDWEQRIEAGISWCDQIVLTLTPHSVRRPDGYCLNEIAKALELRKPIIPLLLTQVPLGVPTSICRIQYLDWRDAIPSAMNVEKFMQRMARLFDAIEENKLDFEGGQQRLIRYLQPINYDAEIHAHLARFQGRRNINQQLRNWLTDPSSSQALWLAGAPGLGKSAIVATLAHRWAEVAAVHFCVAGNQDKIDPARAILSIAFQLSNHLEEYRTRLYQLDLESEAKKDASTLFDTLLVGLLAKDFPKPDQHCTVLLDGLDEAKLSIYDNPIAEVICGGWSKLPRWLRLIVSSRPEADVTPWLQGITRIELHGDDPEHNADLVAFISSQLISMNRPTTLEFVNQIVARSEGAYHYVNLLLEEFRQGSCDPDNLADLPMGLNQFYLQTFKRRFKDFLQYQMRVRPLLEIILAAPEPVPLSILAHATKTETRNVKEELIKLGSLIIIEPFKGGTDTDWDLVRFSHASLRSWLTAIDEQSRQNIAGPYSAKPDIGGLAMLAITQWDQQHNSDFMRLKLTHESSGFIARSLWPLLKAAIQVNKVERAVLDRISISLANFWRPLRLQFALEPAIHAAQSALDRQSDYNNNEKIDNLLSSSLSVLGDIYKQIGKYDLALSTFSKLIEILSLQFSSGNLKAEDVLSLGKGYVERGELHIIFGDVHHAREDFQKAQKIFEWNYNFDNSHLDALFQIGISHYQVGGTFEVDGDLTNALGEYIKSKNVFTKLHKFSSENLLWLSELGSVKLWIGATLEAQGNFKVALKEYREANEIFDKISIHCKDKNTDTIVIENFEWYKIVCVSYLGGALELNGNFDEAVIVFEENLNLANSIFIRDPEKIINRREVGAAAAYLAKFHLGIGDKARAQKYYKQSFTHFDLLRKNGDPGSLFDWAVTLALGIEISAAINDITTHDHYQIELSLVNFSSKGIGAGLFLKRFWPLLRRQLEGLSNSKSIVGQDQIEARINEIDQLFAKK